MNLKVFFLVFSTVFLMELGDKTQLAILNFAASLKPSWLVFLGGILALIISSFLAVLIGNNLFRLIPFKLLRFLSGGIFILLGILIIYKEIRL
uniref:GDT1 family protein n=1 Tax=candidate division WOR-3 bacterium TaxID=2052148 RepID=A0A7V3ZW22_UNCW3